MDIQKSILAAAVVLTFCQSLAGGTLTLIRDGKTGHKIHIAKSASHVDRFAVKELQDHLKAMSGAVVALNRGKTGKKMIYIGLSPEALRLLGKDRLRGCTAVVQIKGNDLFLYGEGRHGNLYAVYELLEHKLGCRWLSAFGDADHIPVRKTISLPQGVVRKVVSYAFPRRALMVSSYPNRDLSKLFAYRNRQNLLLHIGTPHKGIVPDVDRKDHKYHLLSIVMPGFKRKGNNKPSKLFKIQDYFAIHPEWFSMNEHGKRVNDRQLCFSNKEMRKELTKNLMIFHKDLEKREKTKYFYGLCLNDIAYNMCFCKPCQALQKKYKTPGGSFFDFAMEIGRKYPDVEFVLSAYQRGLTQRPPSGVRNFPKNVTVMFCPINGCYAGTLDKQNRSDLEDLKGWLKLTPRVWVWYYPNTYNFIADKAPEQSPVANFERLASDIRSLAQVKVDGTYFEHDSGGVPNGTNFAEMQTYVMYKLFQDPEQDEKKLMKEFARLYYGKAADKVLQFAHELEEARKTSLKRGLRWGFSKQDHDYLTEKNFVRWNKLLEDAAKLAKNKDHEFRVRRLRMGLDFCIVKQLWGEPEYKALVKVCEKRLLQTGREIDSRYRKNVHLGRHVAQYIHKISNPVPMKALPEELLKYPARDIKVLLPAKNVSQIYWEADPDANQKYARVIPWDGKDFPMGTYAFAAKRQGPGRTLKADEIVKGKYVLYKLNGSTALTHDMIFWSGKNWGLNLKMGTYFRHDDPESLRQKWDVYVSLKFTDKRVYMDRGFIVKVK